MARVLAVGLLVYLLMRFSDLLHRGVLALVLKPRTETYLFLLETALLVAPMILLFSHRVRTNPAKLYASAVLVIFGFVANRLNVSVTGMERSAGVHYVPKWTEIAVTLSIVALGFATFRMAAKWLPVFEAPRSEEREKELDRAGSADWSTMVKLQ